MEKIKGIFYRNFSTSYIPEILKEIYRERIYHQFIEQDGRDDLTVLDCGGNIGLFTQYAYPFSKKIYTVEPAKEHNEVINHMLSFNDMTDKVTVIQKAIANVNGTTTFYHNQNTTMFSLKDAVNGLPQEAEQVETITMDRLFEENNIEYVDFLKLDIEGSECEVIGGEGFQKVASKIKALVVEWHQWSGTNPKQLFTTLSDYGFECFQIPSDATLIGAKRK